MIISSPCGWVDVLVIPGSGGEGVFNLQLWGTVYILESLLGHVGLKSFGNVQLRRGADNAWGFS